MSIIVRPRLSIVATARNDDHGGNLLRRVQIFVNCIFSQADRHKVPIELVLIDWNPPEGKPPLKHALQWPRQSQFCTGRVIEVPPELHLRHAHGDRLPLYQMIAKNVGIVRARGDFILATNIDIIFSDELFALFGTNRLQGGCIYRTDRHDVVENVPLEMSIDEQLEFCRTNIIRVQHYRGTVINEDGQYYSVYPDDIDLNPSSWVTPVVHTNACGDFQLMAREHWMTLRGYPEFEMYSFHIDSLMAYICSYAGLKEDYLSDPYRIYHIDHTGGFIPEANQILDNSLKRSAIPRMRDEELKEYSLQMQRQGGPIIFNTEKWGLNQEALPEVITCLASWDKTESACEDSQPYLSIVVTARNDDHGGNLLDRIKAFLKMLALQAKKFELSCELVIVDWNPPTTKPPLRESIEWPSQLPFAVRVFHVGSEVHDRHICSEQVPLFQFIAKNVGIRRARGKFVLSTNIDILFSDELMWFLSKQILEEKSMYRVSRFDVDSPSIPLENSSNEIIRHCLAHVIRVHDQENTRPLSPQECEARSVIKLETLSIDMLHAQADQSPFTNASGDFTLMSKEAWSTIEGHVEIARADLHLDSIAVLMALRFGYNQVVLPEPMRVFHIEHEGSWAVQTSARSIARKRLSLDYGRDVHPWIESLQSQKILLNGKGWGFASMAFSEDRFDPSTQRWQLTPIPSVPKTPAKSMLHKLLFQYRPDVLVCLGSQMVFNSVLESIADNSKGIQLVHFDGRRSIPELHTGKKVAVYAVSDDDIGTHVLSEFVTQYKTTLAPGSTVLVDKVWRTENFIAYQDVTAIISEIQQKKWNLPRESFFVPSWQGGSYIGGPVMLPILEWVNCNHLQPIATDEGSCLVFDIIPGANTSKESAEEFSMFAGKICSLQNPSGTLEVRVEKSEFYSTKDKPIYWDGNDPDQKLQWLTLAREAIFYFDKDCPVSSFNRFCLINRLVPPIPELQFIGSGLYNRLGIKKDGQGTLHAERTLSSSGVSI